MAYRRLREGLGASWKTSSIAGAMFAAAHIPNPILVPATFLWGTVSTRLFEARPSVPVLGVTQALLSAMLYVLTPVALERPVSGGPGYWAALHDVTSRHVYSKSTASIRPWTPVASPRRRNRSTANSSVRGRAAGRDSLSFGQFHPIEIRTRQVHHVVGSVGRSRWPRSCGSRSPESCSGDSPGSPRLRPAARAPWSTATAACTLRCRRLASAITLRSGQATAAPTATGSPWPMAPPVIGK